MTFNFSRGRAKLPDNFSDDKLVSSITFDKFPSLWSVEWESENFGGCERENGEKGGSCKMCSDDIGDLLPEDPFGMDIIRSNLMTITSWKDIGLNSHKISMDKTEVNNPLLFPDFSLFLKDSTRFHPEMGNFLHDGCDGFLKDKISCDGCIVSVVNVEEKCLISSDLGNGIGIDQAKEVQNCETTCLDSEGGAPHDALFFALGYLGLKDLLSAERVCRSLRDAIKNDTLLWRSIDVYRPLSDRFTDDALLQLTNRAQGTLQCLNVMECINITDGGLKRVLECNPGLTKLCVPGCVRLTAERILFNLKAFKSAGTLGMKYLRIGGLKLSGLTDKHFEELKFLLGADNHKQLKAYKPRFYCGGQLYLSCDDDRAIDIEVCPRCQKLNLVYDCPKESCQGKHQTSQLCRACVLCIQRCFQCGRCIEGCDYEETFFLDLLCMECGQHTVAYQETRYQFCFYG